MGISCVSQHPRMGWGGPFPSQQQDGIDSPPALWGKLSWHISYWAPEVRETKGHKEIQKKKQRTM